MPDLSALKLLGWFMVVIGLVIRYVISRRRFYRRGVGGLQHFSSFEKGLFFTFVERVFSLLAFLILLVGVLILIYNYSSVSNSDNSEIKSEEKELVYTELKGMLPRSHTSKESMRKILKFN